MGAAEIRSGTSLKSPARSGDASLRLGAALNAREPFHNVTNGMGLPPSICDRAAGLRVRPRSAFRPGCVTSAPCVSHFTLDWYRGGLRHRAASMGGIMSAECNMAASLTGEMLELRPNLKPVLVEQIRLPTANRRPLSHPFVA